MSEMLTDLLQNIYTRISTLGKSIKSLQVSIDNMNESLGEKVGKLVDSINTMAESVAKDGETQKLIFEQISDGAVNEIKKLQEKIGLKDLDELTIKLKKIVESSEDALKPEVVDLLLKEVLDGVKTLKDISITTGAKESDDDLSKKVSSSVSTEPKSKSKSKPKSKSKSQKKKGKSLKELGPPPGN